MDEYQARRQPSQSYPVNQNLAKQPEPEDLPLDDSAKVFPLQTPRSPDKVLQDGQPMRSASSRKQSNSGKGRGKQKTPKSMRAIAANAQHPYAEELRQLEEWTNRINQILADRNRYGDSTAYANPGMPESPTGYAYGQPPAAPQDQGRMQAPGLENEETESLKLQAMQIQQRVAEIQALMDKFPTQPQMPKDPTYSSWQTQAQSQPHSAPAYSPQPQASQVHSSQAYSAQTYSPQSGHGQPARSPVQPEPSIHQQRTHPAQSQHHPQSPHTPGFDPAMQQANYGTHQAQDELRHLNQWDNSPNPDNGQFRDRPRQPTAETAVQNVFARLQQLPLWRYVEMPRKASNRLSDAAIWIAIAVIVRVSSRYVLASLPLLSPVFLVIWLTPALLAVFLALFVPKAGWVPFYRIFLIMLGFFIGGKF